MIGYNGSCLYKGPDQICTLFCEPCIGSREHFCIHFDEGCCRLSECMCTCYKQCKNFIDRFTPEYNYIGINYIAWLYDTEFEKYSTVGGTVYGSCIEECMLKAEQRETELCREFDEILKKIVLKSVITDMYVDPETYIPYD